uniref:Ciliogenesis-associated TTC17-interacting protein n=1 Tax=Accipiter nisus TaxID=211598 RepID=A0A8B9NNG2_9AVES
MGGHGDGTWGQGALQDRGDPWPCPPQRALGIQRQAVGSVEAEVFVIERAVHASTGISTVWHSSFLPSGYGGGLARGIPSPASLAGTQEGDDRLFPPTPAGVWPVWCRSAAQCWCFCRMSPSSARQVLRGGSLCPPAQAAPACCLAAKWGTPCSAFLLPGGVKPLPPFPKQPLDWEEDIQLCSWFLDRKEELQASHATYIQQHPELRVLLADFLQALLLQQPCDPVSFAAQFFARQHPPGTPFASTLRANPHMSLGGTPCPPPSCS